MFSEGHIFSIYSGLIVFQLLFTLKMIFLNFTALWSSYHLATLCTMQSNLHYLLSLLLSCYYDLIQQKLESVMWDGKGKEEEEREN